MKSRLRGIVMLVKRRIEFIESKCRLGSGIVTKPIANEIVDRLDRLSVPYAHQFRLLNVC